METGHILHVANEAAHPFLRGAVGGGALVGLPVVLMLFGVPSLVAVCLGVFAAFLLFGRYLTPG